MYDFLPCRVYRQILAVPYAPATFVLHNLLWFFFSLKKNNFTNEYWRLLFSKSEKHLFFNESKGFAVFVGKSTDLFRLFQQIGFLSCSFMFVSEGGNFLY